MSKIIKISLLLPLFISLTFLLPFLYSNPIHAQTLGLSITPPISEIVIMPGKETVQNFTISNDGNDGIASIYLIPFRAQGEEGSVALDEESIIDDSSLFMPWFNLVSPVGNLGEKFYMAGGSQKTVTLYISPPLDAPNKDYYFTLIFELDNEIPQGSIATGSESRARIGTNILISVSDRENPSKNLNITEFSALKVIDSLSKLKYTVRIGNYGSYFLKTIGKISIDPIIGEIETLSLAPLNVISDSIRNISCIESEEIVKCQSSKNVLFGVYKSTISVSADEIGQIQEKTITTVAFPFSILSVAILIFITYRIIKRNNDKKIAST